MSLEANTVLENLVRGSEVTSDSQFSTRVCNNAPEDDEQAAVVLERLGSITFQGVCDGSRKRAEALSPHSDYHDSIHRLNWALFPFFIYTMPPYPSTYLLLKPLFLAHLFTSIV